MTAHRRVERIAKAAPIHGDGTVSEKIPQCTDGTVVAARLRTGTPREAGYRTVGVSGNFVHVAERTGFARGFDAFETLGYAE